MAAGAGRSRDADHARCRRHPKHRHEAGVCPFCLRDRLSRLSAAVAASASARANAPASSLSPSSGSSSSPCSSWEETVVALSSAQAPRPRRGSLGLLLRQEGREAAALAAGRHAEQQVRQHQEEDERTACRRGSNFWARLQQQLHHGGRHRKDGCSEAAEKHSGAGAATHKRAPVV